MQHTSYIFRWCGLLTFIISASFLNSSILFASSLARSSTTSGKTAMILLTRMQGNTHWTYVSVAFKNLYFYIITQFCSNTCAIIKLEFGLYIKVDIESQNCLISKVCFTSSIMASCHCPCGPACGGSRVDQQPSSACSMSSSICSCTSIT